MDEFPKAPKKTFYRHGRGNGKKSEKRTQEGDKLDSKPLHKAGSKPRNRRRDRGPKRPLPGVKLVLRLLPPTLTQDQLLETLEPVVGNFSQWHLLRWYYVQGYYTSKIFTQPVYSRCYFIFESMDYLKKFAELVEPLVFIDDKDNSAKAVLKVSSYCESYDDEFHKPSRTSAALEGTLENDIFFQTFLKSMKLMEETPEYSYRDINLLKPFEKELDKQKGLEQAIKKRSDMALVALAGEGKPKKGKKKKKSVQGNDVKGVKGAKDNKDNKDVKDSKDVKETKRKKVKEKKTKKRDSQPKSSNNNVVIIEAAGKKELQRRKKEVQGQAKLPEKPKAVKKSAKKQVQLLKKETSEAS
ncbi:uncharacterized protein ZBAI_07134 [Zygosaccharomyces bailii ISA1307]|uniref:BN860_10110g1_1 n=1 Tax=Zygosaccharomyces bailii (strain CLIB 213 / ATCC 58445 / CBS 680 / BCRC 21525 / NBRC 1098 / NCYC 1416 / NRRL Y-2227) TaxID=1333698 RepID=A0A8J2T355_ZYGB2|nr:BN860_10110g1_1 [Zygosaccharomyces bailii CLIB 213]CDH15347.1 uncharacterized protein ZBAI_07134 [Zygosaccharomyces bailii ISA1307]